MAIMSLDPTGQGRKRWMIRWKPALNAFDLAFDGRLTAASRQTRQSPLHRLVDRPPVAEFWNPTGLPDEVAESRGSGRRVWRRSAGQIDHAEHLELSCDL